MGELKQVWQMPIETKYKVGETEYVPICAEEEHVGCWDAYKQSGLSGWYYITDGEGYAIENDGRLWGPYEDEPCLGVECPSKRKGKCTAQGNAKEAQVAELLAATTERVEVGEPAYHHVSPPHAWAVGHRERNR